MSRMYSACMAQAVEVRLVHMRSVRALDTAAVDALRECVPFPPPRVEAGLHALLHETSGMRWAEIAACVLEILCAVRFSE
jgi:hypothetical protein